MAHSVEPHLWVRDLHASKAWYESLGFTELESNDIYSHKYTVISDGELNIGLHSTEFDSPAVTFVQQDLARHARSMTKHGFEFNYLRLDEDVFNELGFRDFEGDAVCMVEARTFHLPADAEKEYECG